MPPCRVLQVTKIQKKNGTGGWTALEEATGGDIVSVAGLTGVGIGDTIAGAEDAERLEPGLIDPPTLAMVFSPNSSPLGLSPGNVVTSQKLLERLEMEAANSVSLRVCPGNAATACAKQGSVQANQHEHAHAARTRVHRPGGLCPHVRSRGLDGVCCRWSG